MRSGSRQVTTRPGGFTLVEILVAMVIGMIGIIVMMQVFATAEAQKRTTTGTGDAQSSGALALYELQGAIRQSGYGFNSTSVLNCTLRILPPPPSTAAARQVPVFAPTLINPVGIPAGDADTDTLLVAYGSSPGSSEGDAIVLANGAALSMQTPANFAVGDRVIVAPAIETSPCPTLVLDRVNTVAGNVVTIGNSGAVSGQLLFNLGGSPTIRAYAVRGGNLTACDFVQNDCTAAGSANDPAIWVPIASNVVGLRAEYGWDTTAGTMDGTVDTWNAVRPTALLDNACQWIRAPAVRIALLARNSQVDRNALLPTSQTSVTWAGAAPLLRNETARNNWRNYRYKVFETVVPIRNLPWMARCS